MRMLNTLAHPFLIDAILPATGHASSRRRSAQMEVIGCVVVSGSESDRQITAALMTLSQERRRADYYADPEGFSHKEITAMMNTPVGTVVSPLHRGRRRLRTALFGVAIRPGFALDHTRDHAVCLAASQ